MLGKSCHVALIKGCIILNIQEGKLMLHFPDSELLTLQARYVFFNVVFVCVSGIFWVYKRVKLNSGMSPPSTVTPCHGEREQC